MVALRQEVTLVKGREIFVFDYDSERDLAKLLAEICQKGNVRMDTVDVGAVRYSLANRQDRCLPTLVVRDPRSDEFYFKDGYRD